MDSKKKAFAIAALRRASYRWPGRYKAAKRAHVGRNEYACECCGVIVGRKEKQMDHVNPMIPLDGWDNFDGVIDRLLADENGWQTLCKPCHKDKTSQENTIRSDNKRKKKLDK